MKKDVILDYSILSDFFKSDLTDKNGSTFHFITTDPMELSRYKDFRNFEELVINVVPKNLTKCQQISSTLPKLKNPLFISNNNAVNAIIKNMCGIETMLFDEDEIQTGVGTGLLNSFYFENNIPFFINSKNEHSRLTQKITPWGVRSDSIYQDMLIRLLMDPDIPLVSCLSAAGYGKTFMSLACAFDQIFTHRQYRELYIVKTTHEVGLPLGFLPGNVDDKIESHFDYAEGLVDKLCQIKHPPEFVVDIFDHIKFKPINYLRGLTINDAFVIIDEAQNLKEYEMRTILSRMGKNVKVAILGDNNQIDEHSLTAETNGITAVVKKMSGQKEYGHISLSGKCSRGIICDLVHRVGL